MSDATTNEWKKKKPLKEKCVGSMMKIIFNLLIELEYSFKKIEEQEGRRKKRFLFV